MTEGELSAVERRANGLDDLNHMTDLLALCCEIRRLRALIRQVQHGDHDAGARCLWCGASDESIYGPHHKCEPHAADCPAFTPSGDVR